MKPKGREKPEPDEVEQLPICSSLVTWAIVQTALWGMSE
jgi:hypothetical protein